MNLWWGRVERFSPFSYLTQKKLMKTKTLVLFFHVLLFIELLFYVKHALKFFSLSNSHTWEIWRLNSFPMAYQELFSLIVFFGILQGSSHDWTSELSDSEVSLSINMSSGISAKAFPNWKHLCASPLLRLIKVDWDWVQVEHHQHSSILFIGFWLNSRGEEKVCFFHCGGDCPAEPSMLWKGLLPKSGI